MLITEPQWARSTCLLHPSHIMADCGLLGVLVNLIQKPTCYLLLHFNVCLRSSNRWSFMRVITASMRHLRVLTHIHIFSLDKLKLLLFMDEYRSPYTIVGPVPKWNYFFQPVILLLMQPETKLDVCIWQKGLMQEKRGRERVENLQL